MATRTDIALLPVVGDLDVRSVPQLRSNIDGLISRGCRRIILNMAKVDFVDSAGLALIFFEVRRMRAVGGLISLVEVSPRVMRAFKLSRLVDYVPVSAVGQRTRVPELDPSVKPLWRTALPVCPSDLTSARMRVQELLGELPLAPDEVFDMTLAVGEAMGNAVDHTDGTGVLVTVCAYPDRAVVEVTDCGEGYEIAPDEEPVSCTGCEERGRGIKLMRLLADSVSISRRPGGRGTIARLVKLTHPTDSGLAAEG